MSRPIPYDRFKSGLTYGEVRMMLWSSNPDPSTWQPKSKGVVLRLWAKLKADLYQEYLRQFPPHADGGLAEAGDDEAVTMLSRTDGKIAVRKEILHRGRRFFVTYWMNPATMKAA